MRIPSLGIIKADNMTKNLQDLLDLPDVVAITEESEEVLLTRDELMVEATEIVNALTTSEKIDASLTTVTGLIEHDSNMDGIADKALKTYVDLCSLGLNIADPHVGKIYEVAAQMLKIALEAKDSKTKRKLDMIDLQIRKFRADKLAVQDGSEVNTGHTAEFDRNELLRHLVSTKVPIEEKSDEK